MVYNLTASVSPFAGAATVAVESLRVLSVDDTLICRKFVEVVLARDGHAIVSAADGLAALDAIHESGANFDVVVTDHRMPLLDGLGLVRELRARGYPGGIVVMSSDLEPATEREYRALGVDSILKKPVSADQIRNAVNHARPL
jgi:CheY-like chemotaxis protein